MKPTAIIRAHMGSSRLPGKVMLPVMGRPLLAHQIARLRQSQTIEKVILATTVQATDDILADLAERERVLCYRGSEHDVMDRVIKAATAHDVETIVDVTSDCPLVDPRLVDDVVAYFTDNGLEYASNVIRRYYPRGLDVQVYKTSALSAAAAETKDKADHEHVTLFLYEHPELFRIGQPPAPPGFDRSDLRMTLDTAQDFFLIRAIFEALQSNKADFGYEDICDFLDASPGVAALNQGIAQKLPRPYDHTSKARAALGL